jgi:hypothetical protein
MRLMRHRTGWQHRLSTGWISRLKQPGDAVRHVSVVDQFAPVGLSDASVHPGDKESLALEHLRNRVSDQLLRILAIGKR